MGAPDGQSGRSGIGRWTAPLSLLLALTISALAPAAASAGMLTVKVLDGDGEPVGDAVVMVSAADGSLPAPAQQAPAIIDQSDEMFAPLITIVPVGGRVVFQNSDRIRHHVYSFSPPKPFELQVAGFADTPPVTFDKPGVVAVGCNIHDDMVAWVYVVGAGRTLHTGADGVAAFPDLADGPYQVSVWHPRLRPGQAVPVLDAAVAGSGSTLPVTLRLLPRQRRDGERSAY